MLYVVDERPAELALDGALDRRVDSRATAKRGRQLQAMGRGQWIVLGHGLSCFARIDFLCFAPGG